MFISDNRNQELDLYVEKLGLKFSDTVLLNRAFVHSSYIWENNIDVLESYERLEFLGDAVLKIVVSEFLFNHFPSYLEGELTKLRSFIVSDKTLADFAKKIDLMDLILIGKNEKKLGGKGKSSILACAFEAFLGAIYLEYGESGKNTVYNFLIDNFKNEMLEVRTLNPKALLQEYTQSKTHNLPVYRVLDETGLAHDKTYEIGVFYNDALIAKGIGKSKKDAEQNAAKLALEVLNIEFSED